MLGKVLKKMRLKIIKTGISDTENSKTSKFSSQFQPTDNFVEKLKYEFKIQLTVLGFQVTTTGVTR